MATLIITDVQNDFLPGGALAVAGGNEIIPLVNRMMKCADLVVATQDWHPRDHVSFAVNHAGRRMGDVIEVGGARQALWPVHCVQGTWGADLHPGLHRAGIQEIVRKGTDSAVDSYSAFRDNARLAPTGLEDLLRRRGAEEVLIVGLATDYCVRATALDAVGLGFRASVVLDACRGVEAVPGDIERAIREMRGAGVNTVRSEDILGGSRDAGGLRA